MPASARRIKGEITTNRAGDGVSAASTPDAIIACQCKFCGKYFNAKSKRERFCSDRCRDANKKITSRMTKEDLAFLREAEREKKKRIATARSANQESLAREAFEAREAGMSYGQYTSQRYAPRIGYHS